MNNSTYINYFLISVLILSFHFTTAQWTNVSNGIGNRPVYSLYNNSNYIYAGSSNHGVYLSSDNGTPWAHRRELIILISLMP